MSNQNYRLEEKNSKKIDVHLLYITEAKYEQDWHSLAHTHHFTELFFITHGTGKFTIENECFPVKENDLIIVNPNVSHTESGGTGTPLEYIVLGINGLQFTDKDEFTNYTIHNFFHYREELHFYLKMLLKEVRKKEENFESICQNLLELISLVRHRQHCPLLRLRRSQRNVGSSNSIWMNISKKISHFRHSVT